MTVAAQQEEHKNEFLQLDNWACMIHPLFYTAAVGGVLDPPNPFVTDREQWCTRELAQLFSAPMSGGTHMAEIGN